MVAPPPPPPPPPGLLRHRAWVIVAASLLVEFFGIGFGFFALIASYPSFEAMGWDRTTVVASSPIMILVIAVLSPAIGVWMDRHSVRALFVAGGLVMALGHSILAFTETPAVFFLVMPWWPAVVAYVVLFGLAYGGIMPMMPIMVVECFGLAAVGSIQGVIKIGYDLGAASVPLAAAWVHDRTGSYAWVFLVNGLCAWAAVGCAVALRRRQGYEAGT